MATQYLDRVRVNTATTGTGAVTIGTAVTGHIGFGSMTVGNTAPYTIEDGANWEQGIGTLTSSTVWTRSTVTATSAGGTSPITLSGSAQLFLGLNAAALAAFTPPVTQAQFNAAFLNVEHNTQTTLFQNGFNTLALTNVVTDANGNYNTTTGIYTVPFTGTYQIVSKLRANDTTDSPSQQTNGSFGQGVHTSNTDGPWFGWYVTVNNSQSGAGRNGSLNVRTARFLAGDQLRLYVYADNMSFYVNAAALNILLVSLG